MPPQSQISSGLRLLVSPSSPLKPSSLRLSFFSASNLKPSRSLFTSLLSSSRRHRSSTLNPQQPLKFASTGRSRGGRSSTSSSFFMGTDNDSSSRKQEKEKLEEEGGGGGGSNAVGFNKRRAEGRDKSDKPKKSLQLKVRKLNPTNTISYVQILGTGMDTQDTSPSVLLFFDKQRFIFNAGEGLQRFCTEHKIKLSKIDHIFLSRVCSETVGGIPGLLLTLAGMGDEGMTVNIWGPSNLQHLVDAMKSFIPHAAMVHTKSFGSDPAALVDVNKLEPIVLVNDEVVKISAILVQPRCSNASNVKPADVSVIYLCELPAIMGKFDPEKAKALGLRPGPKYSELQSGKSVKSDRQDIMVNPSDVMGPSVPGPIVVLADCPSEFHAQELLSVQSLNTFYADFPSDPPEGVKTVNCVIHLSPASVTSSPYYQQWMKKFGSAQHIMAGHDMKNVEAPVLISSARIAARLNYLCPQFFPAPGFWSLKHRNNSTSCSIISGEQASVPKYHGGISAENLLKFTLRPYAQLGFDRSNVPITIAPSEVIRELLAEVPEIVDASKQVCELWHGDGQMKGETTVKLDNKAVIEEPWLEENTLPSCLENIRRDDLEIVLLGTGSSQPSKYRNVSSVYINLFSKGSILLDCGEGTLGQLKRRYGVEGADNAVRNLRCIWVSHIHADHHTGLTRLLALRRDLLKGMAHEPLLVIGPRQLKKFLDAYERLEGLDMQFIDCRSTIEGSWDAFDHSIESNKDHSSPGSQNNATEKMNKPAVDIESTLFSGGGPMQSYLKRPGCPVGNGMAFPLLQKLKKVLNKVGLESLVSFPVVHCPQAFGVVLKAAERDNAVGKIIPGWKVVYSGDTRPCPELVRASREATVLIHEATFEDDLAEEAIAKNHTTTKEAIEVGDSAGAYRVILTHFSQRYPKIPVFDETHMHKTCIAFDLMSVNIADLPVLPRVLPYLKLLFRNEMTAEELDQVLGAVSAVS